MPHGADFDVFKFLGIEGGILCFVRDKFLD